MVLKLLSFSILLLSLPLKGSVEYGEHQMPLYYGKIAPYGQFDTFANSFYFQENLDRENFVLHYTQRDLEETQSFLKQYLRTFQCTDEHFSHYKSYIRYLFQIAALSYLDSTLQASQIQAEKIGWKDVCQYDIKDLLKKCNPKTKYMSFFKETSTYLGGKRKKYIQKYNIIPKEEREQWFSSFSQDYDKDLTKLNLYRSCGSACSQSHKKNFQQLCDEGKASFLNICNETDKLYGMEGIPEIYLSLLYSQALREMESSVYNFKGCLRRYSHYYREQETISTELKEILRNAYHFSKKTQSPLGDLFDVSSLKSFLDLGADSLFDRAIEPPKDVAHIEKTPAILVLKDSIKKEVDTTLKVIKKSSQKGTIKKEKEPAKIEYSYFYQSYQAMVNLGFDSFVLDMGRFNVDYSFSPKIRRILATKMENFAQRKTLEEMLKFDKLGSLKSPVPILFIKYMIDTNNHKGLFTITNVLGNIFYFVNDIDNLEKKMIIRGKLEFDTTQNYWQITFLNTTSP